MGMFECIKSSDINRGVEECKATAGALLLDVRTPEEYRESHIPGSENVPLLQLENLYGEVEEDTALYVYCYSGSRSRMATEQLVDLGYTNVHNIGGIVSYRGEVER